MTPERAVDANLTHDIEEPDTARSKEPWIRNASMVFGSVASFVLLVDGLIFSRAEVALIALPIVVSVAWAWEKRPREAAAVLATTRLRIQDDGRTVDYRVALDVPDGTDAVALRMSSGSTEQASLVVDAATARRITGALAVVHSGPQELLRVDYSLVSGGGGFVSSPVEGPRSARVIVPRTLPIRDIPLPWGMFGMTGGHNSVRPGDGGEFRDVHLFAPGDRLRRIDWKVTARHADTPGELYVRRTFATADATVIIVLDGRDDVGDVVERWGEPASKSATPTSMDFAREAATSIASAYIRSGDRVGFQDLGSAQRMVAPAGSLRQLHRLLPLIARAAPVGAPRGRLRPPHVPAGAIVYVISTFLDDDAAGFAALWAASGHRVIGVDVLPGLRSEATRREQEIAARILELERSDRMAALSAVGVELVNWSGSSAVSPESQLSALSMSGRGLGVRAASGGAR